jgi:hypothetical protein
VAQLSSTVASDGPRASAISGADSPPKNFICTLLRCRSSLGSSSLTIQTIRRQHARQIPELLGTIGQRSDDIMQQKTAGLAADSKNRAPEWIGTRIAFVLKESEGR